MHSERVKPVRWHTKGYTGQTRVALREIALDFEGIDAYNSKLKILSSQLNNLSFDPYHLTCTPTSPSIHTFIQAFIRADLFIYIDSLLSYPLPFPNTYFRKLTTLFESLVLFYIRWLAALRHIFPSLVKQQIVSLLTLPNQVKSEKSNKYLTVPAEALYRSGYELSELVRGIFGMRSKRKVKISFDYEWNQKVFIGGKGLQVMSALLNLAVVKKGKDQMAKEKVDFMMLWPVLWTIPAIFVSSLDPETYKDHVLFFVSVVKKRLREIKKQNRANGFFSTEEFLVFRKAFIALYQRLSPQQQAAMNMKNSVLIKQNREVFNKVLHEKQKQQKGQLKPDSSKFEKRLSEMEENYRKIGKTSKMERKEIPEKVVEFSRKVVELMANKEKFLSQFDQKQNKKGIFGFKDDPQALTELSILQAAELLITENKIEEVKRLISWRKKILNFADLNGWEVAKKAMVLTAKKLDLTAEDIILSNLEYLTCQNTNLTTNCQQQ